MVYLNSIFLEFLRMEKNENLERIYFKKIKNYGERSKSTVSLSEVKLVMVSEVEPLCVWQRPSNR